MVQRRVEPRERRTHARHVLGISERRLVEVMRTTHDAEVGDLIEQRDAESDVLGGASEQRGERVRVVHAALDSRCAAAVRYSRRTA